MGTTSSARSSRRTFFDYNGGPDGNYLNDVETAPYSNELAHDVYFADDGMLDAASGGVIAFDVTFRRNLFSRTLQSVKGPYSGKMEDNLFYGYSSGGYVGPWGVSFDNNVLVNGGGFSVSLDNAHGPNEDAGSVTHFCNNLESNVGTYGGTGLSTETLGSSLVRREPRLPGQRRRRLRAGARLRRSAVLRLRRHRQSAPGERRSRSVRHLAAGALSAGRERQRLSPDERAGREHGAGYALEVKGSTTTYSGFGGLEAFLGEDSGTYSEAPFAFVDPSRTIGTYLTASGLAAAGAEAGAGPSIVDFMSLVRAQSAVAHTWSPALDVATINAYFRAGHAMTSRPFAYDPACP